MKYLAVALAAPAAAILCRMTDKPQPQTRPRADCWQIVVALAAIVGGAAAGWTLYETAHRLGG